MTNLPDDYFLDADDELVDFLEKQGEESIKETYQSNTTNIENGYKLLNIQIVGIGSSFLLLTQKTSWDYLTAGLAVFIFCGRGVLFTWFTQDFPPKIGPLFTPLPSVCIQKHIKILMS